MHHQWMTNSSVPANSSEGRAKAGTLPLPLTDHHWAPARIDTWDRVTARHLPQVHAAENQRVPRRMATRRSQSGKDGKWENKLHFDASSSHRYKSSVTSCYDSDDTFPAYSNVSSRESGLSSPAGPQDRRQQAAHGPAAGVPSLGNGGQDMLSG
jgi:hypothetical protein